MVKIDQWFPSSKACSCCGQKRNEMPLKVRSWVCSCGAIHDRDINAAKTFGSKASLD
ncbi:MULTISPECIES: zinc ribbon domain-containing protein [unclassified Endozoicomonas]|uniref:zinc ribbon domain-containing protein n=1 Tax=unclassified Endozoicomonas TaxID=2644528 RepID=UPI003BB7EFB6